LARFLPTLMQGMRVLAKGEPAPGRLRVRRRFDVCDPHVTDREIEGHLPVDERALRGERAGNFRRIGYAVSRFA
jgi:hypothetical protein